MDSQQKGYPNGDVLPGSTLGILGGGQLGRMIAIEGKKLGYRIVSLDPAANCPGSQVSDHHICAPYDDREAAQLLAEMSDVITYEFENVHEETVSLLESTSFLPQGSTLLSITKHRVREKEALVQAGVPVAKYRVVHTAADMAQAVAQLGTPCVLKTVTGGYDGKGQQLIQRPKDAITCWEALHRENEPLILEQWVPFQKELSVIAARNTQGEVVTYPVVENVHVRHILHLTLAPAPVEDWVKRQAEALARRVAEQLEVVGLIAVEMFMLPDGELLVNELAPRPHNSGHYTWDACVTSQFEQHVRAICGLPLGSPRLMSPAVMVNVLGEHIPALLAGMSRMPADAKVHLYGKEEALAGRKMGHVTMVSDSHPEALHALLKWGIWEPAHLAKKLKELEKTDDRTVYAT
jgi:5-(carboxyamino)imidazole ribonucleotide synthase